MKISETRIKGLWLVEPKVFGDTRGFFMETYSAKTFEENGLCTSWAQDNHSRSSEGVIRGLHLQKGPAAQVKLVRVIRGSVLDVAVDLRPDSETFGEHFSVELSEENNLALYVPENFAHGFSVLSESADLCYKCSRLYDPDSETGIVWNDTDLNIDWKVAATAVSDKDKKLPSFSEYKVQNNL